MRSGFGASPMRIFQAIRVFFKILFDGGYAARVVGLQLEDKSTSAPIPLASLQVLELLQREGRLVDFLQEDVDGYDDAQVGSAVRQIHRGCRKVLREYVVLEPIRPEREGDPVKVPEGFDPAQVRLIGNVRGAPPFDGVLRHHGWRVTQLRLATLPSGHDPRILAPAEVEVR